MNPDMSPHRSLASSKMDGLGRCLHAHAELATGRGSTPADVQSALGVEFYFHFLSRSGLRVARTASRSMAHRKPSTGVKSCAMLRDGRTSCALLSMRA